MNTEQQLRERAEAILNNYRDDSKYPNINEVVISKNDAIDFALDFHKQELQRTGEVVYDNSNSIQLLKEWFTPPFLYDAESGGYIFDNNGQMIVEVRGWGMFSVKVGDDKAWEIQNQIGEMIAKMLNSVMNPERIATQQNPNQGDEASNKKIISNVGENDVTDKIN